MISIKTVLQALLVGSTAMLLGCSSSPSSSDGEIALLNRASSESEGSIKLASFRKTDGVEGQLSGFKIYVMQFQAEIEFGKSCQWDTGWRSGEATFRTSKPFDESSDFISSMLNVKAGQRVPISGTLTFMRKESGWAVEKIQIDPKNPNLGFGSMGDLSGDPQLARSASNQIQIFKAMLGVYESDNGNYPQSLADLIKAPAGAENWRGPYTVDDEVPKDPWGHAYIYRTPSRRPNEPFDLEVAPH